MFCQASFDQWLRTIMQHLPHLSKPQATVLALWSFGMVLARSCALTAVSHLLAKGLKRKEQPVRQQLRECITTPTEAGRQPPSTPRRDLFSRLAGLGRQLVAGHATGAGHRCHSVGGTVCGVGGQCRLSRLCDPGRVGGLARQHQTCLATGMAAAAAPAAASHPPRLDRDRAGRSRLVCPVAVSTDCAPWLAPIFAHQYGRRFSARGGTLLAALDEFAPQPGTNWRGAGIAFARNQVPCTLLARWEDGYKDPWLILTDLPPEASDAGWYGLRAWIEQGFKITKRAGWRWHRTRITDPARAARLWLAVAVATLWLFGVGGATDETIPASTLLDVTALCPARPRSRRAIRLRLVSLFRQGWVELLVALLRQEPLPQGRFVPEPWPAVPALEDEACEPAMALPEAA